MNHFRKFEKVESPLQISSALYKLDKEAYAAYSYIVSEVETHMYWFNKNTLSRLAYQIEKFENEYPTVDENVLKSTRDYLKKTQDFYLNRNSRQIAAQKAYEETSKAFPLTVHRDFAHMFDGSYEVNYKFYVDNSKSLSEVSLEIMKYDTGYSTLYRLLKESLDFVVGQINKNYVDDMNLDSCAEELHAYEAFLTIEGIKF